MLTHASVRNKPTDSEVQRGWFLSLRMERPEALFRSHRVSPPHAPDGGIRSVQSVYFSVFCSRLPHLPSLLIWVFSYPSSKIQLGSEADNSEMDVETKHPPAAFLPSFHPIPPTQGGTSSRVFALPFFACVWLVCFTNEQTHVCFPNCPLSYLYKQQHTAFFCTLLLPHLIVYPGYDSIPVYRHLSHYFLKLYSKYFMVCICQGLFSHPPM